MIGFKRKKANKKPEHADNVLVISKEAERRADRQNRENTARAIRGLTNTALTSFADTNLDVLEAYSLIKGAPLNKVTLLGMMDILSQDTKSQDPKKRRNALKALRGMASSLVMNKRYALNDVDIKQLRLKFITAETIQKRMHKKAKMRKEARQLIMPALKCGASTAVFFTLASIAAVALTNAPVMAAGGTMAYALGWAGTATLGGAGLFSAHKLAQALTHTSEALGNLAGLSPLQRIAAIGAITLPLLGSQITTINATEYAPTFMAGQISSEHFHPACRTSSGHVDSRITGSRINAALMITQYRAPTDPGYAVERIRQLSALQGMNRGILPIALYMLSEIESSGGKDVANPKSSAIGLYQSLIGTTLDWLKTHYEEIPAYAMAKQRLEANAYTNVALRDQDENTVLSIETTVADHKSSRIDVVGSFTDKDQNIAYNNALSLALDSVGAGNLMASDMTHVKDLLLLADESTVDLEKIQTAVVNFYRSRHLLGATGGPFLNYVVAQAPNTVITDNAALRRLFVKSGLNSNPSIINSMAGYLTRVHKDNENLFNVPANQITAQMLSDKINTFVGRKATPIKRDVETALATGETGFEMCMTARGKEIMAQAVPETTTRLELSAIHMGHLYKEIIPQPVRDDIANGITSASMFTRMAYNYVVTTPQETAGKTAPAPALTIEGLLNRR